MPIREYTTEEVEREPDGQFVVVDVTTGSYEADENDVVAASDRALARNPDAVLYCLKVGRPAACRRLLLLLQPLTAPAVRPETMRLWKMRTRITSGIVTVTAAAACAP